MTIDDMLSKFRKEQELIDRLVDPYKKFREEQEAIDRLIDPYKKLREEWEERERLIDPHKRLREQWENMDRLINPFRGYTSNINALTVDLERFRFPQMAQLSGAVERLKDLQLDTFSETIKSLQAPQIDKLSGSIEMLQASQFDTFSETIKRLQTSQMDRLSGAVAKLRESQLDLFSETVKRLNEYEIDSDDFDILEDGLISVSGEIVDTRKISEEIDDITNNAATEEELGDLVLQYISNLSNGAKIVFLIVLLPIFLSIIGNILTPIALDFTNDYIDLPAREAKKKTIEYVRQMYPSDNLKDFRIVTAVSGLNVRDIGKKSGDKLDAIPLLRIVKVIEKNKKYTLIEYENENGHILNGWVLSRYLEKF